MEQDLQSIAIQLGVQEATCLVALPAGHPYQVQYDRVVRPVLEHAGITPRRSQEIYSGPDTLQESWRCLRSSRLLVAELTGRDPSVLYYVALAHAIGKPVLALARAGAEVPPAMRDHACLTYDVQDPYWGETLSAALQEALARILRQPMPAAFLEGISPLPAAASRTPQQRGVALEAASAGRPVATNGGFLPSYHPGQPQPIQEGRPGAFDSEGRSRFAPAASRETAEVYAEDFLPSSRAARRNGVPQANGVAVAERDPYPRRFPSLMRKEAMPQVTGVWQGSFTTEGTEYQGLVKVHQDADGLSAAMRVTYISRDAPVEVEEEFLGAVSGRDVTLSGVNYAFIQKGKAREYTLDNFELTLSPDGQRLAGKVKAQDVEGEASFTRVSES